MFPTLSAMLVNLLVNSLLLAFKCSVCVLIFVTISLSCLCSTDTAWAITTLSSLLAVFTSGISQLRSPLARMSIRSAVFLIRLVMELEIRIDTKAHKKYATAPVPSKITRIVRIKF